MLLSGLGISLYLGWILTLAVLGYLPIIALCWWYSVSTKKKNSIEQDEMHLKSDAQTQETLSAIKLVK